MKAWVVPVVAAAAIVLTASWYVLSPWVTLYGIKSAVERRDVEAMIGYVDFPALRTNLKDQVHAAADARKQKVEAENTSGWSVPDRMAGELAMIDTQIDTYVTPETLRTLAGKAPPARPGDFNDTGRMIKEIDVDREGLSTFVVRGRTQGQRFGFVFTNHGLGWKLSGLRLPGDFAQSMRNRPFAW